MKFSKFIVSFIVVINVVFTIGVLYIFLRTSREPTTLIGAFFGFTTVELWQLAAIKKHKIKKENKDDKYNS